MFEKFFYGVIDVIGGIFKISPLNLSYFKYNYFDSCKYYIYFLIIFIPFRVFFIDYIKADTASMNPTIVEGDIMIVNKLSYINSDPQRGDIITFNGVLGSEDTSIGKRVIGLPNDTIQLKDNIVYINGKKVDTTKSNNELVSNDLLLNQEKYKGILTFSSQKEKLDNGVFYETLSMDLKDGVLDIFESAGRVDMTKVLLKGVAERDKIRTTIEYKIPSDSYFVMGDNRDLSNDSRVGLGFIKRDSITSEIIYIFFNRKNIFDGDMRFMKKI